MLRNIYFIPAAALLGLALGLAVSAIPAEAQSAQLHQYQGNEYELDLGSASDPSLSGTATLTNSTVDSTFYSTGTASGTYVYFNDNYTSAPLTPTSFIDSLYSYAASTANVTGGTLDNIISYDDSHIQYSGGTVLQGGTNMEAQDNSTIAVTGGNIGLISSVGTSTVTISGGTVENGVYAQGDSTANVTGGSLLGDGYSPALDVRGTANVSGGLIDGIGTEYNGVANISGGTIAGRGIFAGNDTPGVVNITGGSFTSLVTENSQSVINIFGSGLLETPLGPNEGGYQVTGILEDGQKLNTEYGGSGSLVFHDVAPVPEASTTVSLGLLLVVGLGGLILKKRRVCPEGRKLC